MKGVLYREIRHDYRNGPSEAIQVLAPITLQSYSERLLAAAGPCIFGQTINGKRVCIYARCRFDDIPISCQTKDPSTGLITPVPDDELGYVVRNRLILGIWPEMIYERR